MHAVPCYLQQTVRDSPYLGESTAARAPDISGHTPGRHIRPSCAPADTSGIVPRASSGTCLAPGGTQTCSAGGRSALSAPGRLLFTHSQQISCAGPRRFSESARELRRRTYTRAAGAPFPQPGACRFVHNYVWCPVQALAVAGVGSVRAATRLFRHVLDTPRPRATQWSLYEVFLTMTPQNSRAASCYIKIAWNPRRCRLIWIGKS